MNKNEVILVFIFFIFASYDDKRYPIKQKRVILINPQYPVDWINITIK